MALKSIPETIQKHKDFFATHKTKDINFRLTALKKLHAVIEEYEEKIYESLYRDLHKSRFESYLSDVGIVKQELRFHLKHLKSWIKPKRVRTPLVHFLSSSYRYSEPFGLVLIVAPWNYPVNLQLTPLVGAISAGNCVVLKPSKHSSNTSALIEEMITKTFDEEYISVFQGGREVNQALWNEKFDYIFYTGNPPVGKIVMEAASKNLIPVTLELGGKSPCIVENDAKIEYTGRRIVWGKFLNAGQTCIAPDYLLVNKKVKDELIDVLKKYIKEFYGDNPEESPDFARIINDSHFERLTGLMKNGSIIAGGETKKESHYIAPTIIDNITADDPIMKEEIFGPLLPILEYESLEEAIAFVNSRPKPLVLYFFSENRKNQKLILKQTTSGDICFNDTIIHFGNPHLPYGGVGNSGMGNYHGKTTFDTFSHKKSIIKKSNLFDLKIRYAPYKGKIKLIKFFMK